MATLKVILDTRREKSDKSYPLKLSLSHKNKTSYISIDVAVLKEDPKQWDGKNVIDHPNAKKLNQTIKNRVIQAENILIELGAKVKQMDHDSLKHLIETNGEPEIETKPTPEYTLEDHFNRYISNCRAKGTADMYRVTLGKLNEFAPEITFDQVNLSWLKSFDTFLSKSCVVNTRAIHMRNVRAVFNDAINEDLIEQNLYPFRKFKIRKEKTIKRALSIEQIKQFRDYPVQDHQKKYQDLWMLVFYLIGINTVDLVHLKDDNYTNGRINYIRAKTGREYSIEVLPEAKIILEKYKGKDYLIDVMDNYTNYKDFSSRFNHNLKEIGKLEWVKNAARDEKFVKKNKKKVTPIFPNLTIYAARHSWATTAGKLDIPIETISASLGHGGKTVTHGYIFFDTKKIDQANRDVLAAIT